MPTITAHEHPIRQIFSDEFAFTIPTYQRPYSWGIDQAEELIDDLLAASEGFSSTVKREVMPYFLGSVVLIKAEQEPAADVIDGQQRLTTLSLLLSALRVALDDANDKLAISTLLFEKGNALIGTQDRSRLTLRDRDQAFYETEILRHSDLLHLQKVLKGSLSDPQRRLAQNTEHLRARVAGLEPDRLKALAAYILQHTYLVTVATPDLSSAFRIFSVLNDRGLNLSAADILKAELIGKIPEEEQESFVEQWEEAEEELGTEKFAELFSHIRAIHGRTKLRKNVLDGVRESVPLLAKPKEFISAELIPSADAYKVIIDEEYDCSDTRLGKQINRVLGLLRHIDDTDWVPPAIYYLVRKGDCPDKILEFFRDLERLAASMWLRRCDVNERIKRHGELLGAIEKNEDLEGEGSPLQLSSQEKTETLSVLEGDIYHLTPKKKRTMVLLRLDSALSSGEATYDHERITVEHILPQNPADDSQWINWWPDASEREDAVHRLGNLALLNRRQNSAASNWDFEEKKTKYFFGRSGSSPFALTTEVVARNEWKPEDFSERQQRFVELLAKEWRLRDEDV